MWMIVAAFGTAVVAVSNAWLSRGVKERSVPRFPRAMLSGSLLLSVGVWAFAGPIVDIVSPASEGYAWVLGLAVWIVPLMILLTFATVRLRLSGDYFVLTALMGASVIIVSLTAVAAPTVQVMIVLLLGTVLSAAAFSWGFIGVSARRSRHVESEIG